MNNPIPDRIIYAVYARQIGSTEWHEQETSVNKDDVIYYRDRNNKRNAETHEPGAGREYIAVIKKTTFEPMPLEDDLAAALPSAVSAGDTKPST